MYIDYKDYKKSYMKFVTDNVDLSRCSWLDINVIKTPNCK